MAMGACPGQIPMPCVPPALMVTATMVRACRYNVYLCIQNPTIYTLTLDTYFYKIQARNG